MEENAILTLEELIETLRSIRRDSSEESISGGKSIIASHAALLSLLQKQQEALEAAKGSFEYASNKYGDVAFSNAASMIREALAFPTKLKPTT